MPITPAMITEVSQFYVALFGRAPDGAPIQGSTDGLSYWTQELANGIDLPTVANQMFATTEARAYYPGFYSPDQIIHSFYLNVLGRDDAADPVGHNYWLAALNAPGANAGTVIYQMIVATTAYVPGSNPNPTIDAAAIVAQNLFNNRVAVAEYYGTNQGDVAGATAALSGVTDNSASVTTAEAAVDAYINPLPAPQTFTLTAGPDTSGILLGSLGTSSTAGNDIINASDTTLNANDIVNGGIGVNTLNLTDASWGGLGDATSGALISNIQTFNIRQTNGFNTTTLDASSVVGLSAVNSNLSVGIVTVTNLATGASIGMIGNGTVVNGTVNYAYATPTDDQTIDISGGTVNTGTANITNTSGAGVTTATISSTGAANKVDVILLDSTNGGTVTSLYVNADSNLTATLTGTDFAATAALVVAGGAASVNLGTAANFKTISATGLTAGALTVTLGTNLTSFAGGGGNDVVTTGAVATAVASAVYAGTGSADVLVIGLAADVSTLTKAKVYAGFDVLQSNGQNVDLSFFTNSTITSEKIAGTLLLDNLTVTQAANITDTAGAGSTLTINPTGATGIGQMDTVHITANDGVAGVSTITLANVIISGVETLRLTAVDNLTVSSLAGATEMSQLNVDGGGNVIIAFNVGTVVGNTTLNASAATGTVTIDASVAGGALGVRIDGSLTMANTLTGTANADVINGGASLDVITGGAGGDTIALGAGLNTLVYTTLTDSLAGAPDNVTGVTSNELFKVGGTINTAIGTAGGLVLTDTGAGTGVLATDVAAAITAGTAMIADGAALVQITSGTDAGYYLVINDGTPGFAAGSDAVVHLTGVTTLVVANFIA